MFFGTGASPYEVSDRGDSRNPYMAASWSNGVRDSMRSSYNVSSLGGVVYANPIGNPCREHGNGVDLQCHIGVDFDTLCFGGPWHGTIHRPSLCVPCSGRGSHPLDGTCRSCRGHGSVMLETDFSMVVPASSSDGSCLLLQGQGGEDVAGGPRGDLHVVL